MLSESILGRAQDRGFIRIDTHQIRDYTANKQNQVDDYPYGGGRGAVMTADPLYRCWEAVCNKTNGSIHTIYLSPCGKTFKQGDAIRLRKLENIIFVCGHYEGIDQRVIDEIVDEEISIGDYVLTGGEIPAMVLIDSVSRYIDGVITGESTSEESFTGSGLLEYPQYTRPEEFQGIKVPKVLQYRHHENINKWRRKEAIRITYQKRPDLLEKVNLTEEEKKYIEELKNKG